MPDKQEAIGQHPVFKCTDIYTMDVISGKWRLPIIWILSTQKCMRYNELRRKLDGITNIMLTRSLQGLEAYGLVTRKEYRQIPPRVEYSLTEKCKDLLPALEIINAWGKDLLESHYAGRYNKPEE
ncbi:helix-turn-helix transcriptional regulator [Clostridia bacterium OttesenSCG-928-O13]|nr:helix-turn-helix transcriptional regulator [Clostridia bacterium OttesenSCG-928-O13]